MDSYIANRLKIHRDVKRLWEDGFLDATEPDQEERKIIMLQLTAVIHELEILEEYYREDN